MSNHYFLAMKSNADSGLIKSIRYLTADEYAILAAKDANTLYLQDFGTSIPLSAATLEATADKLYWRASDTESSVLGSVSQSGDTITFTKYSKTSGSSAVTKGTTVISVPHWTSRLYLGDSTSSAAYLSVSSSPYIKLIENGALRDSIRFVQGTGILTSSDASGNLTTKIDYANALRRHVMSGSDALATIADTSITSYAYSSQPSDFPVANHSTIYTDRDVGTPYQIVVGDVSYYLWKKSLSGSTWTKMYSGYADHAAYVDSALSFAAGSFAGATSYNGSSPVSVNIPTDDSQLANSAGYLTESTGIKTFRDTSRSTANPYYWAAMVNSSQTGSPVLPSSGWWHVLSMDWGGNDTTNWISQLALPTQDQSDAHLYFRKNSGTNVSIDSASWIQVANKSDVGVTKITAADSTLTLSPNPIVSEGTIGINLGNANTWTGKQTFHGPGIVELAVPGYAGGTDAHGNTGLEVVSDGSDAGMSAAYVDLSKTNNDYWGRFIYWFSTHRLEIVHLSSASTQYEAILPDKSGTLALTSDIPTKLSSFTNDVNYITGSTYNLYEGTGGGTSVSTLPLFASTKGDKLCLLPADQIIIEKSTDSGATWVDAGYSDSQKMAMFSGLNNGGVYIPKNASGVKSCACMLRITISAMKYNVPDGTAETSKYNYWNSSYVKSTERYGTLGLFYFWLNSNSDRIALKIERAAGNTSTSWETAYDSGTDNYTMVGWSGMNQIRLNYEREIGGGTDQIWNMWNYRITLRTCTNQSGSNRYTDSYLSTSYTTDDQGIYGIAAYGANLWSSPNNLVSTDHAYTWDNSLNATFPANVTATTFIGALSGNASTSTYPFGFSNRSGSQDWGNQTGTFVTGWGDSTGGSLAFRRDNPTAGQLSEIIDGYYYQNEGRYRVLDTSDLSSLITTSNIGSQSVNYASSAGSVDWSNVANKPSNLITTSNIGSQSVNYASSAGSVSWANILSKPSNLARGSGSQLADFGGASTYCRYFKIKFDNETYSYLIAFGRFSAAGGSDSRTVTVSMGVTFYKLYGVVITENGLGGSASSAYYNAVKITNSMDYDNTSTFGVKIGPTEGFGFYFIAIGVSNS